MIEIIELETERLRLRQWLPADRCQFLIAERGWGFWATEFKETGQFIGFVGLHIPASESLYCSLRRSSETVSRSGCSISGAIFIKGTQNGMYSRNKLFSEYLYFDHTCRLRCVVKKTNKIQAEEMDNQLGRPDIDWIEFDFPINLSDPLLFSLFV